MTQSIIYKEYEFLMARIAWWLLNNNKQFKKREKYNGVKRETVEAQIRKGQGKIQNNTIAEYVECAIEDNKSNLTFLPNYVTNPVGVKYYKDTYVDMAQRVSAYEVSNKKSPSIVYIQNSGTTTTTTTTKCNTPWTQSPVLTAQKPGALGQTTPYSCGPHSLMQAFYNLTGLDIPESKIMSWAGTTTSGTGHAGLNTAVAQFNKVYNQNIKIMWKNLSDFGSTTADQFKNLAKLKCEGKFIFFHILYRDQYGHYEAYKTCYGNEQMFDILNSLGSRSGKGYNGYIEKRNFTTQRRYIGGISQPSVAILYK